MSGDFTVRVVLELTPGQAAGLKRLADKLGHAEALAVLYPHIPRAIRDEQATEILTALAKVHRELEAVPVWPWIDTGAM